MSSVTPEWMVGQHELGIATENERLERSTADSGGTVSALAFVEA